MITCQVDPAWGCDTRHVKAHNGLPQGRIFTDGGWSGRQAAQVSDICVHPGATLLRGTPQCNIVTFRTSLGNVRGDTPMEQYRRYLRPTHAVPACSSCQETPELPSAVLEKRHQIRQVIAYKAIHAALLSDSVSREAQMGALMISAGRLRIQAYG